MKKLTSVAVPVPTGRRAKSVPAPARKSKTMAAPRPRSGPSAARPAPVPVPVPPAGPSAAVPARAAPPMAIGARLRHARLVKGLLLKQLAERVGVSISLISKYENDHLLPPLTVLHALVTELETNIGALFEANWTGVGYVARAGTRPRLSAGGGDDGRKRHDDGKSRNDGKRRGNGHGGVGVVLERLVPNGRGHLLQGNIHIVAPGGGSMGPMRHEGDEVGYVLEGRLDLRIDDTLHRLGPGDSFAFPSHLAHSYCNPGSTETRVLWINTPPTF
jgi:quercetin dioxygenase-like cupin family protein/DNA-binding XRE family transcriptional regulator